MKKKLIIAFLALVVLGLASIPALYPLAKIVRSQQHLSSAIELKTEGDDRNAYFKIQSAYNLRPEDESILGLLGSYASAVAHPNTLTWWTEAADRNLLERDEVIEMIEYGLNSGQQDRVRPYLYRLSTSHPEDPDIQKLQVRFLQLERRQLESFRLARELVREGIHDEDVLSAYIQGAFTVPQVGEEEQENALSVLRELAGGKDEKGLFAVRVLLRFWSRMEDPAREALARDLHAHPEATFADHLALLSQQRSTAEDPQADFFLEEAETLYKRYAKETSPQMAEESETSPEEAALVAFTAWLIRSGFLEAALEHLGDPMTEENEELFHARQTALITSGQASEAYNRSLDQNPLSPARNLILRAMAQAQLEDTEGLRQSLSLAAESVEIEEIGWMENILRNAGELDLLIRMFEQLETSLPNPLPAQIRLLPYYYASGRQDAVARLVREVNPDLLTRSVEDTIPFLYFRILFGVDTDRDRRSIENLVHEMPVVSDFRILLAFSYAISGKAETAAAILEESVRTDSVDQRIFNIMMAFVHITNNDLERAGELIEDLDPDTLLPQERALLSPILSGKTLS